MLTSRSLARCLVLLSVNAFLLSGAAARPPQALAFPTPVPRAIFPPFGGDSTTDTGTSTDTAATSTTSSIDTNTSTSTSTSTSNTSTSTSDTATSTSDTSTSTSDTATSTSDTSTPTSTDTSTSTTPPPSSPSLSASVSRNAQGQETTVFMTVTPTNSGTASASATSAGSSSPPSTKSDGISKSTIIGLSVSGGVAAIGLITFIVWKFTRKRFTDDDFDNEAIKWPELNAHGDDGHALPTNRTGGAGFETSSQVNLARPDSRAGSVAPSAAASSVELYANHDPYAVPPLPHLNPNMPYRDDPNQYYDADPYAPAAPAAQGEAYPMTQINRTRSPAPQMAYQGGFDGRASPGPQAALGVDYRARSPGPAASLYAGRASPGPQAGRMSPGPQMAYGQGGGY